VHESIYIFETVQVKILYYSSPVFQVFLATLYRQAFT